MGRKFDGLLALYEDNGEIRKDVAAIIAKILGIEVRLVLATVDGGTPDEYNDYRDQIQYLEDAMNHINFARVDIFELFKGVYVAGEVREAVIPALSDWRVSWDSDKKEDSAVSSGGEDTPQ